MLDVVNSSAVVVMATMLQPVEADPVSRSG